MRFNNVTILPQLDLIYLIKQQMKGVDIILNFKVRGEGRKLLMPGYDSSVIKGGMVELAFCFGGCNATDKEYHVAGFSIVKFYDNADSNACYQFRSLPCQCKKAGCEYSVGTGDCRKLEGMIES